MKTLKMTAQDNVVSPTRDEVSKRRIRNRLSQRHFRERKSNYIKELEERAQAAQLTESERNTALMEEITELRSAVLKLRSQVSTIANELECVGADIGRILHVADGKREVGRQNGESNITKRRATSSTHRSPSVADNTVPSQTEPHIPALASETQKQPDFSIHSGALVEDSSASFLSQRFPEEASPQRQGAISLDYLPSFLGEPTENTGNSSPVLFDVQQPTTDNYNEALRPKIGTHNWKSYMCTSSISPTIVPSHTNLSFPPGHYPPCLDSSQSSHFNKMSIFSQHIELLERQARYRLDLAPDRSSREIIQKCCSTVISAFVNNAWPQTWSIWFESQVPNIIGPILSWRINPTIESLNNLLPDYKPTQIQLREPHSAVIDWVPYAPLRDRVIMFYNASAELDHLLCDMLDSYVIEVDDVSRVLRSGPSGRAYFGVWNIFSALNAATMKLQANIGSMNITGRGIDSAQMLQLLETTSITQENQPDSSFPAYFSTGTAITSTELDFVPFELNEVLQSSKDIVTFSNDIQLQQATTWRLDPLFFDKWPELKFDGFESIVAKGRSYRFPSEGPRGPTEMTAPIRQAYQEAISCLI